MFNRAAFNRTAFNRSADVAATDISYSATISAAYEQTARLTSYISHTVTATQAFYKTAHLCAGVISSIYGAEVTETETALTAMISTSEAGDEHVQLNVKLSCYYSVFVAAIAEYNKSIYGASGYYGGLTMLCTVSADLAGAADVIATEQGEMTFGSYGKGCADDIFVLNGIAEANTDCVLIINYSSLLKSVAEYKESVKLSGDYKAPFDNNFRNGYATMNAYISSKTVADYVFEISCSLPAGAVLVIDSENFTATIDGVNVLYAQNGEWAFISRNTQQISLDITDFTNTDNVTGRIIYRDRYL